MLQYRLQQVSVSMGLSTVSQDVECCSSSNGLYTVYVILTLFVCASNAHVKDSSFTPKTVDILLAWSNVQASTKNHERAVKGCNELCSIQACWKAPNMTERQ